MNVMDWVVWVLFWLMIPLSFIGILVLMILCGGKDHTDGMG